MMGYGIGRVLAARHYGLGACDDDDERMPVYIRFFFAAGIFCVAAALAYLHSGDERYSSFALGMATALICGGLYYIVRRWLRRRRSPQ